MRYYPENSPIWSPPKPTPPFSNFQRQFSAEFGSGNGPSLHRDTGSISLNWIIIIVKILGILIIFGIVFVMRELWQVITRKQSR